MSVPTEDKAPLQHPTLGDLRLWYPVFEKYAAAEAHNTEDFHGAHVADPVDLDRLLLGLEWLEKEHGDALLLDPLPTLEQLRDKLAAVDGGGMGPADDGSPAHNLWHWIHGD